jgi:hypothetical protein
VVAASVPAWILDCILEAGPWCRFFRRASPDKQGTLYTSILLNHGLGGDGSSTPQTLDTHAFTIDLLTGSLCEKKSDSAIAVLYKFTCCLFRQQLVR